MNDKEWADAVSRDLLKAAPSVGAKAVKRVLLRNIHLGRRGAYDAAASYIGAEACV